MLWRVARVTPATDESESNATCDLISAESLAQITGGQDLFVTGGHIDADERSGLSGDVLTTGSPTDLVRVRADDIGGAEARTNAEESRRGQPDSGACEDITPCPLMAATRARERTASRSTPAWRWRIGW